MLKAAGHVDEVTHTGQWSGSCPYGGPGPAPDRFAPLALLVLDLVRSEMDTQPEAVIACAAMTMHILTMARPSVARAVWEDGFLDVFQASLRRYNPIERISKKDMIPGAVLSMFKDVTEGAQMAGVEVIQPLLEKGAIDLAIATLTAYQMLGNPEDASVCGVWWGALFTIEILLGSPQSGPIVASKLRSAGVDSVRFLLDHPLVQIQDIGLVTGVTTTRIAALVWGSALPEHFLFTKSTHARR